MAIRGLGIIGDKPAVPELIHLVYHGNVNTHWWAQISLVRLTGQNFARDWKAWGEWWNKQNGQPPFNPEIIRWWGGQLEPDELDASLAESDRKFLDSLKAESAGTPPASPDLADRLREATPLMNAIKQTWSAFYSAVERQDATNSIALLRALAPQIKQFRDRMKGAPMESAVQSAIEQLKPLMGALEKGDLQTAQTMMQSLGEQGQRIEEQIKAITEAAAPRAPSVPTPVTGLADAVVLHRDNGVETGFESISASGHAVQFTRPAQARYVEAVQIYASRYGTPEPPQEDFHLYILNEQQQVLADVPFPYSLIERGDKQWYTLRTPSIEVPEKFIVALNFNPHRTKGIYLAHTSTNAAACYSLTGLPGEGFEPWKPVEWMVRASLTAEPTKAKGFQRLADWKPPVASAPFANCRFASFGGDTSEGRQSYSGRGPAIRFKPADVLSNVHAGEPLTLKGVRLYASRYGSGYPLDETKLRVQVLDAQTNTLEQAEFAYANFNYRECWVDLVFAQPVTIRNPGDTLTIAFDPEATRFKGIYFHYQKNPPASHSLAGTVSEGFQPLADREWTIRAAFE